VTVLFFGALPLLVGVSFVFVVLRSWKSAQNESDWARSSGVILATQITNSHEGYVPRIEYEYTFDGTRFVCGKFRSVIMTSSSRNPSKRVIERYPIGASVTVYVNPNNPADAVLEPSDSETPFIFGAAVGCLFALIGGVVLIRALFK
jgi:hypothetical protein